MKKKLREEKELNNEEKIRLKKFEKVCDELEGKGYKRHNLLTTVKKSTTLGYLIPLPFVIIFIYFIFITW